MPGRITTTVYLRQGVTGSKSRIIRWVGHVAYMGEKLLNKCSTEFVGKCEERRHLEDISTDGRIILKWILNKWRIRIWTEFIWSGWKPVAGSCECAIECVGSHKGHIIL
jgi:hypothetical protein